MSSSVLFQRPKSQAVYKTALSFIPGGVNSPVRAFKGVGIEPPLIVESGSGALIRDVDGNEFIDYCMSWGALILGHAHPEIVKEATVQVNRGSSFGIATELEVCLARKIASIIPSIEKIRLVSSGTEATMTALRLARGFTGRSKVLKFSGHYHGHVDSLLIQAGSGVSLLNPIATSLGVHSALIADTLCFPFNDTSSLINFFRNDPRANEIACVILEPVAANMGVVLPDPHFLQILREETSRMGALLIFDEVITGFRLGLKGAQGLFGVVPDLTCFGKVMGGGFPAAAVGGKGEILDCLAPSGQVYQAGTLSGNPVAVAAGRKVLEILEMPGFYTRLEEKTNRLTAPIREAIRMKGLAACLNQCGSLFSIFFGVDSVCSKADVDLADKEMFYQMFRFLFEKGIYPPPHPHEAWFLSSAHNEDQVDYTVEAIIRFIRSL